jgi:uncharacterized protein with gpF-like domain
MERSKFLQLNWRDFFKGLIVAILTAVLILFQTVLIDPSIYSFKAVAIRCGWTALAATVAYLLKNLGTNSKGELLTPEG